jgi:hypothetical protein
MNPRELLAILVFACASTRDGGAQKPPARAEVPAAVAVADAGVAEDAPCASDADCGFTKVAPGACCPMLCTPRVVTRERAEELAGKIPGCGGNPQSCPEPLCRPPLASVSAVCEGGRCVGRTSLVPSN